MMDNLNASYLHTPNIPRSILYTPGYNLERLVKARESGADVCLIDLEDSVPLSKKALARKNCLHILSSHPHKSKVAVRINELRSPEGLLDINVLIESTVIPDILVMTMITTPGLAIIGIGVTALGIPIYYAKAKGAIK